MNDAYFRRGATGSTLVPTAAAGSLWGGDHMRGMAVSGALARAVEAAVPHPADGPRLRPARWRLDLFRAASLSPCVASTTVVKSGRRLCLVDAVLHQGERAVARAGALFLAPGASTEGKVWAPAPEIVYPPSDLRPATTEARLYYSEGPGWTAEPGSHGNGQRKQVWIHHVPVVEGEEPSPFQVAAMAADVVNVVTNWGDQGIEYINADVSLALARLPEGEAVGLVADHRAAEGGIAAGAAVMFDRRGPLGTATVSALAMPGAAIDPRELGDPL